MLVIVALQYLKMSIFTVQDYFLSLRRPERLFPLFLSDFLRSLRLCSALLSKSCFSRFCFLPYCLSLLTKST